MLKRINPAWQPCDTSHYPYDIPSTWQWVTVGDIAKCMADGPFGSNLKAEHYTKNKEVRIIQLSNLSDEGWRENNVRYTTFEHLKTIERSSVLPGDLVVAKMMPAGRTIICPNSDHAYVLSSDAVKLVPNDAIYNKYILYLFNSPWFRSCITDNIQGVTRLRTSITKIRNSLIPLPPLAEQHRIVEKIEAYLNYISVISNELK